MKQLKHCRYCRHETAMELMLDLGTQHLSGIFPMPGEKVPKGPLQLVQCKNCQLVQLGHEPDLELLYGPTYGYRSGLNQSMVTHLREKVHKLLARYIITGDDVVLDIGSSDGTLLKAWHDARSGICTVGFDPQADRFKEHYHRDTVRFPDFFEADSFLEMGHKAKVITAVAMFYDLPDPVGFLKQLVKCLAPDGVIHLEFAYLSSMLREGSFDTVCHEHLEYYSLNVVRHMARDAGLEMVRVELNTVNGGSVEVELMHKNGSREREDVEWLCKNEGVNQTTKDWNRFKLKAYETMASVRRFLDGVEKDEIAILGASTKGNVLLQFCGVTNDMVHAAVDVNEEKWGKVTPGTGIPIISEAEAKANNYQFYLVLPWHFREGIIAREDEFLDRGGKLIFPLPEFEIVSKQSLEAQS